MKSGSRTRRPSSSGSTRSTTAGRCSAGSPSGRSAPASSRWPAARSAPGCASTASARWPCAAVRLPGIEPTGLEPWGMLGESLALASHAYHATTDEDDAYARAVFATSRGRVAPGARPGEPAPRLPGHRPRAVRARRLGPAARRGAGRRRGRAARPRRALRLQPDDADDGVGADRPGGREARPGPDRRGARRARRPAAAGAARRGARPRRATSRTRGASCSCGPPAGRRSPSRRSRRAASSRPRR